MKYINPKSIRGLVNRFADFIVSELSKDNNFVSIINVTYLDSFFVINGITESDKVLNIGPIKDKFFELNKGILEDLGIKQTNTIDVIKYNKKPEIPTTHCFEFYNSDRVLFKKETINLIKHLDSEYESINYFNEFIVESNKFITNHFTIIPEMVFTSEYPYGYSVNSNRSYLYYCEYICNHLFKTINMEYVNFKFSTLKDEKTNDQLISIKTDSIYGDDYIKSLILDVFDFNIDKFVSDNLSGYDVKNEIDSQLEKKPWNKVDRMNDMVIF